MGHRQVCRGLQSGGHGHGAAPVLYCTVLYCTVLYCSQADTGTALHLDPDYTIAWNSVLAGTKLWALLPLDLAPATADQLSCRPGCSHTRQEGTQRETHPNLV